MKFNWRRTAVPIILTVGLLLCFSVDSMIGLGVSLVAFALIIGFSNGKSRRD